jgi:thioredoxin-related protein
LTVDRYFTLMALHNFLLATRDPAGTQVLADSSWNSGLMQHLVVTSIPRFILLDGNGRIIDANAPRPSDRALRELIAAN